MVNTVSMASIASLTASIGATSASLQKKREDLIKLQAALTKLKGIQSEFHGNKHLTEKPKLQPKNWHGKHANQFKRIQEEIQGDYDDLSDTQLAQTIRELEAAIERLKLEIAALEASLAASSATLATLKA